jgi:meso-butanediol dehydrogenase / (S,S)-butanediol dehydrogenase / diacetyl reductase
MSGRVVVIVGGTSGIGEECVKVFARKGDRVVFTGTSEKKAAAVMAALAKEGIDREVRFCRSDISREAEVKRLAAFVTETFGPCDVLCNNASILVGGAVHETSPEDWNRLFAVNVTGTFHCCRAFIPEMLKRRRGVIVNTASISGMYGEYGMAAYCATKGAICNLTHAMALDYADEGIRVNAVCPGATRTDMFVNGTDDNFKKKCEALFPPRRVGLPAEVADAVYFLASDEARFVNGVLLPVDGGISAHTGQPRQDKGNA